MYDLSFGVRLPEPKLCPQVIAHLLTTCFYERPDNRPDFKAIKATIINAYNQLVTNSKSVQKNLNVNEQNKSQPSVNEIKDQGMKNSYAFILKGNQPSKDNSEPNPKSQTKNNDVESIEYLAIDHKDSA